MSGLGVDTICSAGTDLFSEMRLALAAERSRANAAAVARGERVETVISTNATCCGSPPSMAPGCGTSTTRWDPDAGQTGRHRHRGHALTAPRRVRRPGRGDGARSRTADVETVIVGGEVVKRDGQLAGTHVERPVGSCTKPRTVCASEPHFAVKEVMSL